MTQVRNQCRISLPLIQLTLRLTGYLYQPDHIYIVTVIHGSRDLMDLMGMDHKPWEVG